MDDAAPQPAEPGPPYPPAQSYPPAQPYSPARPYGQGEPAPGTHQWAPPPASNPGASAPGYPPGSISGAESWAGPGDVRAAALLAGGLIVVGILAGVFWSAISPHAQGVVVSSTQVIPLEQENWIAADGRFALITAVIGLIAGVAAWFWRGRRGPVLAAGLAIGAGIGALLTALVGYWLSSGHESGAVNTEIRLKVLVHAHGLIALEAVLAVGAYLIGVLFCGPDDLGRPESASTTAPASSPVGVTGAPG